MAQRNTKKSHGPCAAITKRFLGKECLILFALNQIIRLSFLTWFTNNHPIHPLPPYPRLYTPFPIIPFPPIPSLISISSPPATPNPTLTTPKKEPDQKRSQIRPPQTRLSETMRHKESRGKKVVSWNWEGMGLLERNKTVMKCQDTV